MGETRASNGRSPDFNSLRYLSVLLRLGGELFPNLFTAERPCA
jgi:hypothetical protein